MGADPIPDPVGGGELVALPFPGARATEGRSGPSIESGLLLTVTLLLERGRPVAPLRLVEIRPVRKVFWLRKPHCVLGVERCSGRQGCQTALP